MSRVFDRIQQHDPRSRAFGVARLAAPEPPGRPIYWTAGPVLDQGAQGHCGGFAAAGEAAASPVRVRGVDDSYAHGWYYEVKDRGLDPWGREEGTSTLAVLKVGQLRGLWASYLWAFSVADVVLSLPAGPGLAGVPWMTGMMRPDVDGRIQATGVEEGGHLVCVTGWSPNWRRRGPHFRIQQSWGRDHGAGGRVYLSEEGMYRVLVEGRGEYGFPVDRSLPLT